MLTPDQISTLGEAARKITAPVSEYLLQDITRRVAEAGQLTSTAQYQVWRAQQLGVSQRELKKELRRRLGLSHQEIRRILYQSAQSGYDLDIRRFPYVQALPFARNASLQQIVAAAVELAQADFTNLTQTLGMVDPFGKALPLQDAYRSCTDFAFQQVVTGAASYTEAIRQATRNLAEKGVRTIDYQSGVHTSLEAAVRRNILGGLGLMLEQVSQVTHDQLGCNGWEISAHANSAPDHEPIQGRQYPDREYEALNNSLRRRIGTLNCGHTAFPVILGVNRPQHPKAELEQFRADNEKGVDIDGQHYTGYEATQMQRKLERTIRAQKRRVLVDEAARDKEKLSQDQSKLTLLHQRYAQFSKAAGLKTQYERTEVAGFGGKTKSSLERLNFSQSATKEDRLSIEQEVAQIPQRAREIAEGYISQIVVTNGTRSGYRPSTGELFLNRDREPGTVAHEYAHALETALNIYEDPEFLKIREKGFENLTASDIIIDTESFSKPIFRVESGKLVTPYQGRLYEQFGRGIFDGKQVYLDGMREYFSEGFMFYVHNPEILMQKDPELFEYIRRLLE